MATSRALIRNADTPYPLLENNEITLKAKGLYALIYSKGDDWDFSAERLAESCKEQPDAIRSALKELEKFGYLKRRRFQHQDTGHWDVEYTLMPDPGMENRQQAPGRDFPGQENGALKKNNTKENNNSLDTNKDIDNNKAVGSKKIEPPFSVIKNPDGVLICQVLRHNVGEFWKLNKDFLTKQQFFKFISDWSKPSKDGVPKWFRTKGFNVQAELAIYKRGLESKIPFDLFWDTYDNKEGRKICVNIWDKLPAETQALIMEDIPKYFASLGWKKKKNPSTYLRGEHWLDERTTGSVADVKSKEVHNGIELSPEVLEERTKRQSRYENHVRGFPYAAGQPIDFPAQLSIYHVEKGYYDELRERKGE